MADDFLNRAYQFFLSSGYPSHAAAALAANAIAESGGNTRAVHDNNTGIGIYGFRDPEPGKGRKTALLAFARERGEDYPSERTQLEFAAHELQTSEKKHGDALKASKDYTEAQAAVLGFLRPQGYSESNPAASHNYAGRWNAGASLAGVQPIMGPAMAAAGSADTPVVAPTPPAPTAGLLAGTSTADAAAAAAAAQQERAEEAAYAELTKTGMGLLAKGTTQAPPFMPVQNDPGGVHIPDPSKAPPLPNYAQQAQAVDPFLEQLMRQRLQRRV